MKLGTVFRLGGQGFAVFGTIKALRQSRSDGDRLAMLDAVLHGLAIGTTIALLVRELKRQRESEHEG